MSLENILVRYINLDYRPNKNINTLTNLEKIGFNKENIKRFSAVDGKNLVIDIKNKNYFNDPLIEILRNLNKNYNCCVLACLLSHYFLLKEISMDDSIDDDSIIFIFEDDFFINKEYLIENPFTNIIEKLFKFDEENDWSVIYFGGRFTENFSPNNLKNNNSFQKIDENFYLRKTGKGMNWDRTTHNYVIKKKNTNKISKIILENFINSKIFFEIDSLYNNNTLKINFFDYFPHIFYSPINYRSDIQRSKIIINTSNLL
jgi:GR25 family glycosyltransferase involved in LPS biosynthesis